MNRANYLSRLRFANSLLDKQITLNITKTTQIWVKILTGGTVNNQSHSVSDFHDLFENHREELLQIALTGDLTELSKVCSKYVVSRSLRNLKKTEIRDLIEYTIAEVAKLNTELDIRRKIAAVDAL